MRKIEVRAATPADAESLLAIYAPYVRETAITFEYEVPTVAEFRGRIEQTLEKFPYLVAVSEGEIIGYVYAGVFRKRTAYAWDAETSLYVRKDIRHSGVGRRLYEALERALLLQNYVNLSACITTPETEDAYLTFNSLNFHSHMGYSLVGSFHRCGYKFGRWYHITWMEKSLTAPPECPQAVKPFREIQGLWEAEEAMVREKLYGKDAE